MKGAADGARILAALRTEISLVGTVSRAAGLRIILAEIGGGVPKIEHVPAFAQLGYQRCGRSSLLVPSCAAARAERLRDVAALLGIAGGKSEERHATSAQNMVDTFMH